MSHVSPAHHEQTTPANENAQHAPWSVPGASALDQRHNIQAGLEWVLSTIGATTLVLIHPDNRRTKGAWLDAQTITQVSASVLQGNSTGWNVYFTVNVPRRGTAKKPAKSDIISIRAVFADIDAKDGRTIEQAREAIGLLPEPSVIIASGGGYQPIWLLPESIPATAETTAHAEALGGLIARRVDGDRVQSIDHILRVPFTTNHPTAKKRATGRMPCPAGLLRLTA